MLKCFLVVLCAFGAEARLRSDVVPSFYRLSLDLSSGLDNPTNSYKGSIVMTLNVVTTQVQNITFHASDLTILNTSMTFDLQLGSLQMKLPTEHNISIEKEYVTLSSDNFPAGTYTLFVDFEGKFAADLQGFYKSSYLYEGNTRWMASTQFETQGARKAFPCFDEPAMRSKWILQLTLPSKLHAVSNMPIVNITTENNLKKILFAESPALPTYLMAWFVSDDSYGELKSTITDNITYTVYGRVDLKNQGDYALNVTPQVIGGLESFTGVKFTSSGMSLVGQAAIPDFSAGAMENWGLVTYRESYLMYDDVASSVLDKQQILMVIAHELAHQWFGDAVTLEWWSYTWLNEGFARYFQYIVPNQLEPSWMIENHFLTDVFQQSMIADLGSHPLTNPNVTTMDECEDMFDVITYGKGASMLRMFSSILGEDTFKQWLNTYLTRTIGSGRVATPEDLFAALPDPVLAEKFKPWTEQAGHPVVIVSRINNTFLRLSQVKEDMTGSRSPSELQVPIQVVSGPTEPSMSFVPLADLQSPTAPTNYVYNYTVQTLNSSRVDFWLGKEPLDLSFNVTLPEWYLINANSIGYYRVLYDEENWKALRDVIDELSPLVRAQLVNDALSLMKTGYLKPQVALDFVKFLKKEKDLLVWKAALMTIKDIRDHLLEWADARDALDEFVRSAMNEALTFNLDQSANSHYETVLQMYIARQACIYFSEVCTQISLLKDGLSLALLESLDRDTNGVVMCALTKNDWSLWDELFLMYKNSQVPTQKARYLNSLSCTDNSTLQMRLLDHMLSPEDIKLQDFKSTFTRICDAKNGAISAMNFIRNNGNSFVRRVSSERNVRKMLETLSSKLYTEGMIGQMRDLLNQTPALDLTSEEKSQLISNARKSFAKRRIVAERICEGFGLTCVPVLDPTTPHQEGNGAAAAASSIAALLTIAALLLF